MSPALKATVAMIAFAAWILGCFILPLGLPLYLLICSPLLGVMWAGLWLLFGGQDGKA